MVYWHFLLLLFIQFNFFFLYMLNAETQFPCDAVANWNNRNQNSERERRFMPIYHNELNFLGQRAIMVRLSLNEFAPFWLIYSVLGGFHKHCSHLRNGNTRKHCIIRWIIAIRVFRRSLLISVLQCVFGKRSTRPDLFMDSFGIVCGQLWRISFQTI